MRKLIFIRHSHSQVLPEIPPAEWPLSEEGQARCVPLAEKLAAYDLKCILTSPERKAAETGRIIAAHLQIPCEIATGLREHEHDEGFLGYEAFIAGVTRLLTTPDRAVFGKSGRETVAHFEQALQDICARYPTGNLGLVTHGRVLALYLAARTGEDALDIWQGLHMPDYRVVIRNS